MKSKRLLQAVYIFLLMTRFFTSMFQGYIHPDEFFQGGQELFYGCSSSSVSKSTSVSKSNEYTIISSLLFDKLQIESIHPTWEFQHQHAIRSIVPPFLMTMFPLHYIYLPIRDRILFFGKNKPMTTFFNSNDEHQQDDKVVMNIFNGVEIWIIPRFFMTILSILIIDLSLWYILSNAIHYDSNNNSNHSHNHNHCRSHVNHDNIDKNSHHNESSSLLVLKIMIVYASSWTTLLFLNRPFSNTLETLLLTWLLYSTSSDIINSIHHQKQHKDKCDYNHHSTHSNHHYRQLIIIGIICSLGLFTRFTFAFYAFPIILIYIHENSTISMNNYNEQEREQGKQSSSLISKMFIKNYMKTFIKSSVGILFGFVITSIGIVFLDSDFYSMIGIMHQQQQQQQTPIQNERGEINSNFNITITPWNAFQYNSKLSNLSDHGIHPRITHILVNLPMLLGPLALYFYFSVFTNFYHWIIEKNQDKYVSSNRDNGYGNIGTLIYRMCYWMVVVGIVTLSCAPHQEPRFLLPLLVPLVILYGKDIIVKKHNSKQGKTDNAIQHWLKQHDHTMVFVWIIFNLLLLLFFGIMHQGGVIPSLLKIPQTLNDSKRSTILPTAIITFHTYMPPTFLLRQRARINDSKIEKNKMLQHCSIADSSYTNEGIGQTILESNLLQSNINSHHHDVCKNVPVIDLKGDSIEELLGAIESKLHCNHETNESDNHLYVIAPNVFIQNLGSFEVEGQLKWFQISTEDIPPWNGLEDFIHQSFLDLYVIRCS